MTRFPKAMNVARALFALAVVMLVGLAKADVPPPNACYTAGEPCQTAGPGFTSAGVCTKTTCSKPFPEPTEWECTLCMEGDATSSQPSGGGCAGCALGKQEGHDAWLVLAGGVALWTLRRRRGRR